MDFSRSVLLLALMVGACASRPPLFSTQQTLCRDGRFGLCSMIDNRLLRTY